MLGRWGKRVTFQPIAEKFASCTRSGADKTKSMRKWERGGICPSLPLYFHLPSFTWRGWRRCSRCPYCVQYAAGRITTPPSSRGRINQWNLLRSVIVPARLASWPLPQPENLARDKAVCAGPCSIALPPTGRRSNIRRAHRSDYFVAALMIGAWISWFRW